MFVKLLQILDLGGFIAQHFLESEIAKKYIVSSPRIQRYSIECRITKTKVIILVITKEGENQSNKKKKKHMYVAEGKQEKSCTGKSRQVLVLLQIGRQSNAAF